MSSQPLELRFFCTLIACGNLSAAARDQGVSTAAVSKRLSLMESRLKVTLVNRTTRRMSVTPEGETYLRRARQILADIDDMEQMLGNSQLLPTGLLRVNATLGFGRSFVAPTISRFARAHPAVEVQLQLSVHAPPMTDDAYDVCIRFGAPPDSRVVARQLAPNRRLVCAAPAYLKRAGTPRVLEDLTRHQCIGIRQGDEAYGVWRFTGTRGKKTETIKTRGALSTNDGEIAVQWALEGHGILMRSEWDIARYLKSGRLVQVLPQFSTPEADIYAVYPQRHQMAARVRAFVDFAAASLA